LPSRSHFWSNFPLVLSRKYILSAIASKSGFTILSWFIILAVAGGAVIVLATTTPTPFT